MKYPLIDHTYMYVQMILYQFLQMLRILITCVCCRYITKINLFLFIILLVIILIISYSTINFMPRMITFFCIKIYNKLLCSNAVQSHGTWSPAIMTICHILMPVL